MRISDWSSDVCSSDLTSVADTGRAIFAHVQRSSALFDQESGACDLGLRRAASLRNREDLHRSRRERPDLEAAPGTSSIASRYDEADPLLRPNLGPRCQPLGRFQNLDESSHYEFICLEAGVPIIY